VSGLSSYKKAIRRPAGSKVIYFEKNNEKLIV